MKVALLSHRHVSDGTPDPRLTKFQDVLQAARHTDYYPPRLEAAHLSTPEAVAGLRAVEEALERLAVVELHAFLHNRDSFRNHAVRTRRESGEAEVVLNGWRQRLGFPMETLAGPVTALKRLAADAQRGVVAIPPSVRRVIVHSRVDRLFLLDSDREMLWQSFGLPVFEQLRGFDDELLAWECDAHDGLHINSECALAEAPADGGEGELVLTSLAGVRYPLLRMRTGLIARRVSGLCGCGQRSSRLVLMAPTHSEVVA